MYRINFFLYLTGKAFYNMDINFATQKLTKIFNSEKLLRKEYGSENVRIIIRRMMVLRAAPTLEDVSHRSPKRRHELKRARKGKFTVDLKQPYRLIFKPNHKPLPKKDDGGIDIKRVTAITILGVEDYH